VGDFIISKEQLSDIFSPATANKLIKEASDAAFSEVVRYQKVAGQEQLVFPNVKFSTLNSTIIKYIDEIGKSAGVENVRGTIENYFDRVETDVGHVFGFSNTLLARTKQGAREAILKEANSKIKSSEYIGEPSGIAEARKFYDDSINQLNALDDFINSLIDVLAEYDIATSDIKGLDLEVNAKYKKANDGNGNYTWLFEWQGKEVNQKTGSAVGQQLGKIKQAKGGATARGLFAIGKTNPKLLEKTLADFVQSFIDKSIVDPMNPKVGILQQKGSPALIDMILDGMAVVLGAKPKLNKSYSDNAKLKPIPIRRVTKPTNLSKETEGLKKLKQKVSKEKSDLAKAKEGLKQTRINNAITSNITSLQALLDKHLQDVISANMGDGSERRVLNYRTGRFAASAKVERLSVSREGMVTAFYTYQKNPYQTFEPGYRQGSPKTRDPKLLIAGAIREIAATTMITRMRSVLI
jgi:hypothetical protein